MKRQIGRRKANRKRVDPIKKNVNIIVVEREGGKEQEDHETVSQRTKRSTWGWHEEFEIAWCETLITKKKK